MSWAVSRLPAVSNPSSEGTQEGTAHSMVCAQSRPCSIIHAMASRPATLTISCGSASTVVVPCGRVIRANSAGASRELSMCMCASM